MDETTRQALSAVATASRTLALALDNLLNGETSTTARPQARGEALPSREGQTGQGSVWDPEVDAPLTTPKVLGTREEQDWCCLTYLGGIYAINKRHNRGANRHEVRYYAMKAGYRDGRAVTQWSKGNGATQNDEDKQRWVTNTGVHGVKARADKLGLTLPDDLAEPWDPPVFSSDR